MLNMHKKQIYWVTFNITVSINYYFALQKSDHTDLYFDGITSLSGCFLNLLTND